MRTKNKALMRRRLAAAGLDAVVAVELGPDDPPAFPTFPAVVKPREGVASEDVVLVGDERELVARSRRSGPGGRGPRSWSRSTWTVRC